MAVVIVGGIELVSHATMLDATCECGAYPHVSDVAYNMIARDSFSVRLYDMIVIVYY